MAVIRTTIITLTRQIRGNLWEAKWRLRAGGGSVRKCLVYSHYGDFFGLADFDENGKQITRGHHHGKEE